MESATAAVRSTSHARARSALVYGGARGARRVVGAVPAAARARRRAPVVVAVASHHQEHLEPLPSRAQEGGAVAVATTQADEAEVHANDAAAAAAETSSPQLGKTVRVRFVLQKQCTFGQSVCLVGDDPALGLWDPLNAFALEWAEESHDWILEKDLPANKPIEFKFLLQDSTGKLHWQDGPNRSFQTGETTNTLVVFEDWDDVRNQKIAEEEGAVSTGIEQTVVSNDSKSRKDTVLEEELVFEDWDDVRNQKIAEEEGVVSTGIEQTVVSNDSKSRKDTVLEEELVFEDWDDVRNQKIAEEEGVVSTGIEQTVVSNDSKSRKDTVLEEELQVDDNQVKEDESVVAKEDKKPAVATDASVQVDWVKTNEANPQKSMLHEEMEVLDELLGKENMENSSISSTDENYAEKTGGDNILSEDGVPVENGLATAYEHDLLWGWKALQRLLMSMGF